MGSISQRQTPYPAGIHQRRPEFLVGSGLHGIVIAGTNGEAATLTPQEKSKLVSLARSVAHKLGRPELAITCGTFGCCTQAIIEDAKLAAEAGADFALVLVPSYFHFALDQAAVIGFFEEVVVWRIYTRKTCVEIFNLYVAGKRPEAEELQTKLASVEWGFGNGKINGTKWVVGKFLGYPEDSTWCRRPYPQFLGNGKREWIASTVKPLKAN